MIWLTLAANGKRATYLPIEPAKDKRPVVIVDTESGARLASFQDGTISFPRLAPGGESKAAAHRHLWRQRIAGGPPQKMIAMSNESERIFSFDWSMDGKRFAMVRGNFPSDIVLMKNFR